jgi:hypothetical protein
MRTHHAFQLNRRSLAGLLAALAAVACSDPTPTEVEGLARATHESAAARAGFVEIEANGLQLSGPDEIPSGWTTFRLNNNSGMVHFAVLEKLPEGIGLEEQQAEVAPVFQEGMDLLNAGLFDEALAAFGALPAWFFEVVFLGGPGLIAGGGSAETTVFLEPGTYLLECYVKTNGRFHSYNPSGVGMVHEITVTGESSSARPPAPTLQVDISSAGGIQVDGHVRPGRHTVAVNFIDQTVYGHFLGHDVHLVRLEDDSDMAELGAWMNWTLPDGLETPAPAEFLGGVNDMPAGATGYMNVVVKPGRYAWIAEVPDPAGMGMLQTFEVP